jgi:hypothetical protein
MSHLDLISTITRLVRDAGAAAAIEHLRTARPAIDAGEYHDTLAVFHVWAVDRLVTAGLSDLAIVWHPLTDSRSPLAWWDAATLRSIEARESFVASTLALPGEVAPSEPLLYATAA